MKELTWINKIYVINLERSKERWENCMRQAKKYHLDLERFTAIDGSKLTLKQRKHVHPLCEYLLCSNGMIGCGLSHLFILKKIIDEKIPIVLVLEDDFIWRDDTIDKLNQIQHFDKGMVKLTCMGPYCSSSPYKNEEPKLSPFPLLNTAYLIRYTQAKQIYEKVDKMFYHIDFQYSMISKYYSIPIYYYNCIDVGGMKDSTIGVHKKTFMATILPLSDTTKWLFSETFMCPFGIELHLFLFISLLLILLGIFLYPRNKWIGIGLIGWGLLDIIYSYI
jgi:glycosyl transferase family 25